MDKADCMSQSAGISFSSILLKEGGADPFGVGTAVRPWDNISDEMSLTKAKMEVDFEFCKKLHVPFFCFHDRDIAPEGDNLRETNKKLDEIVEFT